MNSLPHRLIPPYTTPPSSSTSADPPSLPPLTPCPNHSHMLSIPTLLFPGASLCSITAHPAHDSYY